mmetsp:Transcript_78026/g.246477  ORF Transcript_78026/g.246477 Transcript_78026/m.246477 type:complete len:208 (-) Transcript_78026:33-656(-)
MLLEPTLQICRGLQQILEYVVQLADGRDDDAGGACPIAKLQHDLVVLREAQGLLNLLCEVRPVLSREAGLAGHEVAVFRLHRDVVRQLLVCGDHVLHVQVCAPLQLVPGLVADLDVGTVVRELRGLPIPRLQHLHAFKHWPGRVVLDVENAPEDDNLLATQLLLAREGQDNVWGCLNGERLLQGAIALHREDPTVVVRHGIRAASRG